MRFVTEVLSITREIVGDAFPMCVRISGSEKAPDGLELDDAKALARKLEIWGVDLIHVATGSNCESLPWYFQHMALPPGINEALAAEIRKEVEVPVMAAGRLGDPERIREVIGSSMIDMVALGRPLLADPDLPEKMRQERDDEVLRCGHCLQACFASVKSGQGIACNFNPRLGYESEEVPPAARAKHVVVVGGGPAGLQAVLTARSRGHRVTLYEKDRLGGQFVLASIPPKKERIEQPLRSLVTQVERAGVEIHLPQEATRAAIEALNPDVVILATGSHPAVPDIPGLDDPITAEELLRGSRTVGSRVLVLGGGMVGIELAEMLAGSDKEVVVTKRGKEIAPDMDPLNRKMLLKRIESLPVELHPSTRVLRLEDGKAFIEHHGEERELGQFDSVVVATGNQPFDPLSKELLEAGLDVHVIGDAAKAGQACDAIRSGHLSGMNV